MKREIRSVEIRALDGDGMTVEGRAIIYDTPALMYEWDGVKFYEVIARGALDGADMKDVAFKYNHSDAVMIMARTRNRPWSLTRTTKGCSFAQLWPIPRKAATCTS